MTQQMRSGAESVFFGRGKRDVVLDVHEVRAEAVSLVFRLAAVARDADKVQEVGGSWLAGVDEVAADAVVRYALGFMTTEVVAGLLAVLDATDGTLGQFVTEQFRTRQDADEFGGGR
ncbi:hypothetical protein [Nocardia farcinica]|uniref:hypothetical protein n=1 Tax=Nocardia farcinica TaxID=37329 RepID=UPI001894E6DD|nr:hypothetical protein [Nocardia farcinica]MBF6233772.1 hypothetical protein [Nocardia farcinica]